MSIGYIMQDMSSKLVRPHAEINPPDGDRLVLWNGAAGEQWIQLRFVPVSGQGHFGYIEHVQTGKIVHPQTGLDAPSKGTDLVLHSSRHVGALFMYDSFNKTFMHKSGKYWHPHSGTNYPANGTKLVLWDGLHQGSHFKFVDGSLQITDFYSTPTLSGEWKLIHSVINPAAQHTYKYSYKIGKSTSTSSTEHHGWNVSAGLSINMIVLCQC